MKTSLPGISAPGAPVFGQTARLHDKPFLSIEQAIAHANERQRITDAARKAEAEIAERLRSAK